MQCNEVRNHFAEFVAEDLGASRQQELARHVQDCPECRSELETLTDLWVKLGTIPAGEPPSSDLEVRLRMTLEEYRSQLRAVPVNQRSREQRILIVAATLLMVVAFGGAIGIRRWMDRPRAAAAIEGSLYRASRETSDVLKPGAAVGFD